MPRHDRRRGSSAGINKGDAGDQIAMITGSADAPIRIRAIHGDRGEGATGDWVRGQEMRGGREAENDSKSRWHVDFQLEEPYHRWGAVFF